MLKAMSLGILPKQRIPTRSDEIGDMGNALTGLIGALESTTEQFIFKLKNAVAEKQFEISETTISQIEKLFTKADLVKFAKISGSEEEQNADKKVSENIISVFHKTLPTSAEEQRFAFAKLVEEQKKQKQKNIRQTAFIVTFLVSIVSVVFFFGWENVTNYCNAKINGKDADYYLKKEGMVSEIAESIYPNYISIKHLGYIVNDIDDTTSEEIRKWAPAFENYTLEELEQKKTLFKLDMDATEEYYDMFLEMWPKALTKLKEVSEADIDK